MTEIDELERRIRAGEDELVPEVARRWLDQARTADDPVACSNALRWLSAREDDACRALRGDQLRFQRSVVKLEQQAFRPALVELTAAVTLLEQAVATTGAVELVVTLEHARPLLVDLENTVVQLDRAYRVPATARCAFCGCSSQHGRRMIPGLGDAVI